MAALGDYDRLVELTPDAPMACYLRDGPTRNWASPAGQWEDFGRAIALDPDSIESISSRAILYIHRCSLSVANCSMSRMNLPFPEIETKFFGGASGRAIPPTEQ